MKVCPVCESMLFDDMETCFGCLYRFGSDPILEAARTSTAVLWPHVHEAGDGDEGDDGRAVQELVVPGWRLRVRAEGPLAQGSALTIEIEPALE